MRRIRRWLAVAVLIAALVVSGWVLVRQWQLHTASEQALHAAESYALKLTTVDADGVDAAFAAIADGATGEFAEMHARSSAKLRQQFADRRVSARGHVVDAAVKSATRDTAVVVLLINQSVTNEDLPEPVVDRSRIRMTMQKVDGRWLASNVELL